VVLLRRPSAPHRSECSVLLIQRRYDPFRGTWALPGGFVEYGEDLTTAVEREVAEETSLDGLLFRQFKTYGDPRRDPRGHTISVVFLTEIVGEAPPVEADDDAMLAKWFSVKKLPELAFDHQLILRDVLITCGLI
jgi:8-oxo-dGTP diphosphatase